MDDVLSDLVSRARARGAVFADSTLRAPWGVAFRDRTPLSFHAVLAGSMHVEVAGAAPAELSDGDVALIASPEPYAFRSGPGVEARPIEPSDERVHLMDGPGPETRLLCGAYTFGSVVSSGLLAALPPLVVLPAAQAPPELRAAVDLLRAEVRGAAPGTQAALDRLLDLLLVLALRAWGGTAGARLAALDDPVAGPALRAMHGDPAHPWTVAGLAARAGLSRAAFARRFAAATGTPPMAYLAGWRMALAAEALLQPGATLASVAREVGYGSEFAFAAAFKRHHGEAPGRWRAARRAA
jgi:AraC-like DNA-binding protein